MMKNNIKLLLMLGIFICLVCVICCVSATDSITKEDLHVGDTITIYIPSNTFLAVWDDYGSKGVKLIHHENTRQPDDFHSCQTLTYKIVSEDFNIKLWQHNYFWRNDYYDFNKNPYETLHGDHVPVEYQKGGI